LSATHPTVITTWIASGGLPTDGRFVGRINDQAKLNALYAGAYLYLHGHEVGGTNPSLLRAMDAGAAH